MPDVYNKLLLSPFVQAAHLGKVEQETFYRWQHLHHPLQHLTPRVPQSNIVYTRHLEARLAHQVVGDPLRDGLVREVGIRVEGL
jgi:hypothetical protein